MITARSTPNIALIKYWGNRHDEFRLCANDNVAMTLDGPYTDVSVELAETLSVTSANKEMTERNIARFAKTLELIKSYLATLPIPNPNPIPRSLSITINSHIPPSIGLASSAAVFAALAKAISGLTDADLSDEQISVMARLGSGSAARSIFGGFGAIRNEENNFIDGSKGWQVADEHHWNLHDIIIVPSTEEKKVGSTEGHASAWTSPDFEQRVKEIGDRRQQECIDAILSKDFEKLQNIAEEDAMDMHHCMQTQNPPLNYLSDETYRIIEEVKDFFNDTATTEIYTLDAGPTVHLFCTDEARERISAYAHEQVGCTIFEAKTGEGTKII